MLSVSQPTNPPKKNAKRSKGNTGVKMDEANKALIKYLSATSPTLPSKKITKDCVVDALMKILWLAIRKGIAKEQVLDIYTTFADNFKYWSNLPITDLSDKYK